MTDIIQISVKMSRFGLSSIAEIDKKIEDNVPGNTVKTQATIWRQFTQFCEEKKYKLESTTTEDELINIMKDWGFNMKKQNGGDYKEAVVKTMWNVTAKLLQQKYFKEFERNFDPFQSLKFKPARDARDTKRRALQVDPTKIKKSAIALEDSEVEKMHDVWSAQTPEGLQKKFFVIASIELAWRGGEGSTALINHFREETKNDGAPSGRIEYNPVFTKTTQGGNKKMAQSKWLTPNTSDPTNCPVRLFKELTSKRNEHIKTDRLFLTPNPHWTKVNNTGWYKNMPVGKNSFSQWLRETAVKAGLDMQIKKITNHSSRATAVTTLAKAGVSEQQIMKITGHANPNSIQSYLHLDPRHHGQIVKKMRRNDEPSCTLTSDTALAVPVIAPSYPEKSDKAQTSNIVYNNCTFNCTTLNMT